MDLYYMDVSAPCRSVMLVAKVVGVDLNMKKLDLFAGEQMKPEFLAINPQHCVPTLVDGELKLWESRAICTYLATKYGKDNFYPADPSVRVLIDRFLYFDMGTLYYRFGEYVYPVMFRGQDKPDPEKLAKLQEALGWLDTYLTGHEYAVGNDLTVADCVLVASVETFVAAGIDIEAHSRVKAWLEKCRSIPDYAKCNGDGAKAFGEMAKAKLNA
ncbi:glutathione S-transferase 1-like [Oratosquilla oratoria]|uniref:glutathione S-transferase 1-like n=1 Tax=Oratosquilla oratoria TaxID=337810 RepID=UPI003F772AF0